MKTNLTSRIKLGTRNETIVGRAAAPRGTRAFTLIELLVVIAIIAIIAAMTMPVIGALQRTKNIKVATAELSQIEGALGSYKAKYGVYPPSNANIYTQPLTNSLYPQLYYELIGVTNSGNAYVTLDNAAKVNSTPNDVNTAYGVGGFINCSKGSGDDLSVAKNFLPGLRQVQLASVSDNGISVTSLVTAVHGPDKNYNPLGGGLSTQDINPFRYVYPGVQNPNSYDLWVKLSISGKTYLICNWSSTPIINSSLP